jgi:hypothetical protein
MSCFAHGLCAHRMMLCQLWCSTTQGLFAVCSLSVDAHSSPLPSPPYALTSHTFPFHYLGRGAADHANANKYWFHGQAFANVCVLSEGSMFTGLSNAVVIEFSSFYSTLHRVCSMVLSHYILSTQSRARIIERPPPPFLGFLDMFCILFLCFWFLECASLDEIIPYCLVCFHPTSNCCSLCLSPAVSSLFFLVNSQCYATRVHVSPYCFILLCSCCVLNVGSL